MSGSISITTGLFNGTAVSPQEGTDIQNALTNTEAAVTTAEAAVATATTAASGATTSSTNAASSATAAATSATNASTSASAAAASATTAAGSASAAATSASTATTQATAASSSASAASASASAASASASTASTAATNAAASATVASTQANSIATVLASITLPSVSGNANAFLQVNSSASAYILTSPASLLTAIGAVSTSSLSSTLSGYVTSSSLTSTLSSYALTTTLSSYVTSTALTSTLSSYVTSSSLSSTLSSYVTSSSLSSTLSSYVTASSLSTSLSSYLTTASASSTYAPLASPALTGTPTMPSINGTSISGNRNRIINGNFLINQRIYVSGTALSSGSYAHDRWKAGASGCTYTFTQQVVDTTITITAGTLQQVIEAVSVEGGTYTLSWIGTAQARVNSGSYGSSPLTVTGIGTGGNVTVEFNTGTVRNVQFEPGSTASTFERRLVTAEQMLCYRYYQVTAWGIGGYSVLGVSAQNVQNLFIPMRATPTVTYTASVQSNVATAQPYASGVTSFENYATVTSNGGFAASGTAYFSAEL